MNNTHNLGAFNFNASPDGQNLASATSFHARNAIDVRDLNMQSNLHAAISFGTAEDVSDILSSGAPTDPWNPRGNQPLHEAIIKGDCDMVKLLLRYGADVDSAGSEGKTPIHLATSSLEIMALLLKQRPQVSHQDGAGNTALHLLLQREDWSSEQCATIIDTLLSCGADINITNNAADAPLHLLINHMSSDYIKQIEMLTKFLEHDPDISAPMSNGSTLFKALLGKLKSKLNRSREGIEWRRSFADSTKLERQCLNRFLSLGADPNTVVTDGMPLLHYCLKEGIFVRGHGKELLIRICQLADVNLAGLDGNYPLHHILSNYYFESTSKFSKLEIINLLIDNNANVSQKNADGKCPLELLLTHCFHIIYATPLLKAGASSTRLLSTGASLFDSLYSLNNGESDVKTVLEADLIYQPSIINLGEHAAWTAAWRAACNEPKWIVAKHLLLFEDSYPRPTSEIFLKCTFIVIVEKLLKAHKAQLVLWQARRLHLDAARIHREEYVAILRDCNERQAGIDPSWYRYLLEILDFN